MAKARGVNFTPSSAKRIAVVTRYVEQQPRSQAPELTGPADFAGAVMMHVTTQLPRMVGATPGVGAGKIQNLVSGSYSDFSSTTYPMVNPTTFLVAVGSYCLCVPSYGQWTVISVDKCANLS